MAAVGAVLAGLAALRPGARRARARGRARRCRGFEEPLPPDVCDPIDADYVPLSNFEHILRPGPNITVWELPSGR